MELVGFNQFLIGSRRNFSESIPHCAGVSCQKEGAMVPKVEMARLTGQLPKCSYFSHNFSGPSWLLSQVKELAARTGSDA